MTYPPLNPDTASSPATIVRRTVTSKPGAAIHVTELELSEEAKAGLRVSREAFTRAVIETARTQACLSLVRAGEAEKQAKRSMVRTEIALRLIEHLAAALAVAVALAIGAWLVWRMARTV